MHDEKIYSEAHVKISAHTSYTTIDDAECIPTFSINI